MFVALCLCRSFRAAYHLSFCLCLPTPPSASASALSLVLPTAVFPPCLRLSSCLPHASDPTFYSSLVRPSTCLYVSQGVSTCLSCRSLIPALALWRLSAALISPSILYFFHAHARPSSFSHGLPLFSFKDHDALPREACCQQDGQTARQRAPAARRMFPLAAR